MASTIQTWHLCVVTSVYGGKTHNNDVALGLSVP
jgi:hypothetical protein